jgi:CDP-diacylglycerol--serine O-phosphatidyltransferase
MTDQVPNGKPRRVVKDLPLTRLLPNMLTLMSLCSGLTAIRFSMQSKWEYAVLAVVIAAIFDMLDGRVARMLNIASKFGAELDSLSDAISFGVAPGFVLYEWVLKDNVDWGWGAVLVYAVCTALRLARFNTMLEDHTAPKWTKIYFTGVPAPGGAGLALLPLMIVLHFGNDYQVPSNFLALWLILVGGLMVSRLPTLSLKGLRIAPGLVAPMFALTVLLIAVLITNTWLTLSIIGLVYVFSIPIGWIVYRRRQRKESMANV